MVQVKSLISAVALLSSFAAALPRPDSAVGQEVAVSAPDGTPITDTIELASQTSAEAAQKTQSKDYGSSGCDGGSCDNNKNQEGYDGKYDNNKNQGYDGKDNNKNQECYGGNCDNKTTSEKMDSTSEKMDSTSMYEMTSTSSATYSMPTYGSGNSKWGGYEDCVQQCVAQYGAPPATYYPPTSTSGSESGSKGTGSTITVVVAPTQGVLRYMPAAVNASVGTTIKFMWGAGPHTVTKGSALEPCNKTSDSPFASGQLNKGDSFTQVVNDTNPTYYYCAVPNHCQKGMFGMVNPPTDMSGSTSVAGMMQDMMANNTDLKMYAALTANNTEGKAGATWGGNIDMSKMPKWAQPLVAENVLFTRNLLAMNPELVKEDGSIDLSSMGNTPLMIPQDVSAALNAVSGGSSSAAAGQSTDAGAAQPTESSTDNKPAGNGASAVASPKVMVALMAVVAAFFAL